MSSEDGELDVMREELEVSAELGSEELAGLLGDIQEVARNIRPIVSMEEYDYMELANQQIPEMVLVEEREEDVLLYYPDNTYEDTIQVEEEKEMKEKEKEEDDKEVGEVLPGEEKKEAMSDYDYNGLDESSYDVIVDLNLSEKELDYEGDAEYRKFVDAAKFEDVKQSRMIFEVAMMSGMALICLIIIFGLVSLATSFMRTRTRVTTLAPSEVQITTTGGIIKQYTRIPVEIKNLLPSNVAYKQLYET